MEVVTLVWVNSSTIKGQSRQLTAAGYIVMTKQRARTRDMPQQLRSQAVPSEDPGSNLITHVAVHNHLSLRFQRTGQPLLSLSALDCV